MIESVIRWSIRRRGLVLAGAAIVAVLGAFAVSRTPIDAIPDLSDDQILVFARWNGRGPLEIETALTRPISLALEGQRDVRVIRSSSDQGFALIHLILAEGADVARTRAETAGRLAKLRPSLPADAAVELAADAASTGQIYWYALLPGDSGLDPSGLRSVQDRTIKPALERVAGVAEIASAGGFQLEYEIAINPRRLVAADIGLTDVIAAVRQASAGGALVVARDAELSVGTITRTDKSSLPGDGSKSDARALRDLERIPVRSANGRKPVPLGELARVSLASGPRRGILEMDGNEIVGGVAVMSRGGNPLAVTRAIKTAIRELEPKLPRGVRIVPFYDRTPLIEGSINTVTRAVGEAMLTAAACVVIVMMHMRTSLIIAITPPLAALASFLLMWLCRKAGVIAIDANAMSLAGIAISVGVLVDSSIVMTENVMHRLKRRFGDSPVRGDATDEVAAACVEVGGPIVASMAVMLVSFLPVLILGGMEGKMFRPLAFTKSFALAASALFAITLTPAAASLFIRGRMRGERESAIVRSLIDLYRPALAYLIDHPVVIATLIALGLLAGSKASGAPVLWRAIVFASVAVAPALAKTRRTTIAAALALLAAALVIDRAIIPVEREFLAPLDEGMVMDMPITAPGASPAQAGDDLKARDMMLCRFPEIDMVVGKAGRAETPTDPAPMGMIETMVGFRPIALWPRRIIRRTDALLETRFALTLLTDKRLLRPPQDPAALNRLIDPCTDNALHKAQLYLREYAYARYQEETRRIGPSPQGESIWTDAEASRRRAAWKERVRTVDRELADRAPAVLARAIMRSLLDHVEIIDAGVAQHAEAARALSDSLLEDAIRRMESGPVALPGSGASGSHHSAGGSSALEAYAPDPRIDRLIDQIAASARSRLTLWKIARDALIGFGGELDSAVAMPGWTNVWTMPIQNRVDMLATGVNSPVAIGVSGPNLDRIAEAGKAIAELIRKLPGAADVIADPIRGKPSIKIRFDPARCARLGVNMHEADETVAAALSGKSVALAGDPENLREVVVRPARGFRSDIGEIGALPVTAKDKSGRAIHVPLSDLARITTVEGPASIKSENGVMKTYIRFDVKGRDPFAFIAEAKSRIARDLTLSPDTTLSWTGTIEHEARSSNALWIIMPATLLIIFGILYLTYYDVADALIVLSTAPGAIAGGFVLQWALGTKLSVTAWIGYIACLGMAVSTGIIMLTYLRSAIAEAGGLERMSLEDLKRAVLDGAAHRLRPKLLTEATVVLGLAPVLWAGGTASEVIRPMAAPVLGGIVFADEVIDLLTPILFYWERRRRIRKLARPQAETGAEAKETRTCTQQVLPEASTEDAPR